jgi:4'-phosphopantetheinyl transferase
VRFAYGQRGKPSLDDPPAGGGDLQFNLSNSHELALAGFLRGIEIGVDVEHLRPVAHLEQLAKRFFSREEIDALMELPASEHVAGFFNCWTRKEAYLKAVGEGLAARLDSFAVSLRPGEAPRMLTIEADASRAARWSLEGFYPAAGYVGALAVEAPLGVVRCWVLSRAKARTGDTCTSEEVKRSG